MERFEIYGITAGDDAELAKLLQSLLATKGMKSGSPRYTPLENTIRYISSLGAKSVLVQRNVQDPDFLAEHSAYYSKWSFKVPRFCDRVHFFFTESKSQNPLDFIDQTSTDPDSYLGFITLRPISVSPQAATILKPPHDPSKHFILSKDEFQVNIAGQRFTVAGTPFMQQDNAVGACAQASIWMALRTLRRREGQSAFSPAQITTAATRFLVRGRTLPNRSGLIVEQITEALRTAGYSPHTIPLRELDKDATDETIATSRQALYPYVESGIPVLVLLFPKNSEGHAVLLIGHGWDKGPLNLIKNGDVRIDSSDNPIEIYDASSWVSPFFIHNDNTGPYMPIPDSAEGQYSLADAVSAIPFLQPDIFVDAAEAKLTCHRLLADILEDLTKLLGGGVAAEEEKDNADQVKEYPALVTRIYLQDKADFRAAVLSSDMEKDAKDYYRCKWLPKRVWIMEINLLDGYSESPEGAACRVGEIILDPASEPEDGHFLSIHLSAELLPDTGSGKGVMLDRDAFNGEIRGFEVEGSRYRPLVR